MRPIERKAQPGRSVDWDARIGMRLRGLLPGDGVLVPLTVTACAGEMRLDYLLISDFVGVSPRLFQFGLEVNDDVGTPYQVLGGGFETDETVCLGDREIVPCPPPDARAVVLHFSPSRWDPEGSDESATVRIVLPTRGTSPA